MRTMHLAASMSLAGVALLATGLASGQTYPVKAIRIVSAPAGGGTDFGARIISEGLNASFRQPVIIDNRPAIIQGEIVSKAPPDGYTLYVSGESLWIQSLLQKVPYDVVRDFTPIALLLTSPNILTVHPSLPVKSVNELIALARARPGDLNYGSSGVGASAHLAAELFRGMTRVNIVHIPHKGTAALTVSLISGQVEVAFITITGATAHMKSGKLRALAVTSEKPSALAPGLPTVSETLPGYFFRGEVAMLAPPGLPAPIVTRLNQETLQVINAPGAREKLFVAGFEILGSTPEEFGSWMKSEIVRWTKIIKDAGIRSQ